MADQFQAAEHLGFYSVLMLSFRRVLGGGVAILVAFPLLFWNECSAVTTAKSLTEGAGLVISVSAQTIDPGNDGRLVHVAGDLSTTETLSDPEFNVSLNAIQLRRSVEMYQWKQEEDTRTESSNKTYTYKTVWSGSVIDSSRFQEVAGHENPSTIPYKDQTQVARAVSLGAYSLTTAQISLLDPNEKHTPQQTTYTVQDGDLYLNGDPASPAVGDVRVRFNVLRPGPASVIARQVGNSFAPYETRAGKDISMIALGNRAAAAMFEDAQSANVMWAWIIRFGGFFFFLIGLNLILGPLRVVADRVPLLGRMFNAGLGVVSFFLAAALSMMTISIAWVTARPLLGILLLVIGGSALIGAIVLIALTSERRSAP